MLKLLTYLYDSKGIRVSKREISKARIFVVKNKDLDIEQVFDFPPRLRKEEKIELIEQAKEAISSIYFQENISYVFYIKDGWEYETFDSYQNQIRKPVNRNSKYYTLYFNSQVFSTDEFPKKLNTQDKKKFLEKLVGELEVELRKKENKNILEEYGIELEELTSNISNIEQFKVKPYESTILTTVVNGIEVPKQVDGFGVKEVFHSPLNYDQEREFLLERLRSFIDRQSENLRGLDSSKERIWQVVIKVVPLNQDGVRFNNDYQFVSSPQLTKLRNVDRDIIKKFKDDIIDMRENYVEMFDGKDIGIDFFEITSIS